MHLRPTVSEVAFESKGSVTLEGDPGACLGQPSTFDVTSPQMTGGQHDGGMEFLSVCVKKRQQTFLSVLTDQFSPGHLYIE